jgi:1L-myo-inositol 1-phosphate cytidylyltransferase|nr:MAG: hypothetical protein KatS3mg041_1939 [Bacteroidota bacterium]
MHASAPHTAVILAAGMGSRLRATNGTSLPKPLVPLLGRPLILYVLDNAARAGCQEAVVVLGYEAERIEQAVRALYRGPLRLHFVRNPEYALQNGISVLVAAPYVHREPFLLLMADHLVDPRLMDRIRNVSLPPGNALLVVDFRLETIFDLQDATKVLVEGNRIRAIGKELGTYNAVDTGVFLADRALLEALEEARSLQGGDASLSDGVRRLIARDRMLALDMEEGFWQDVDTAAMHREAEMRWKRLEAQLSAT